MEIRPVGAEMFYAVGRTDGRANRQAGMTKPIVAFHNFHKAPKNPTSCRHRAFMCFLCISEQTTFIFLYNIN